MYEIPVPSGLACPACPDQRGLSRKVRRGPTEAGAKCLLKAGATRRGNRLFGNLCVRSHTYGSEPRLTTLNTGGFWRYLSHNKKGKPFFMLLLRRGKRGPLLRNHTPHPIILIRAGQGEYKKTCFVKLIEKQPGPYFFLIQFLSFWRGQFGDRFPQ